MPRQFLLPVSSHSLSCIHEPTEILVMIIKPCYFVARILRAGRCPVSLPLAAALVECSNWSILGECKTVFQRIPQKQPVQASPVPAQSSPSSPAVGFAFHQLGSLSRGPVCSGPIHFPLSFCFGFSMEGSRKGPVLTPPRTWSFVPVAPWLLPLVGLLLAFGFLQPSPETLGRCP